MAAIDWWTPMQIDLIDWIKDPQVLTVFGIVLATAVFNFVLRRVLNKVRARALKTQNVWDDAVVNSVRTPAALLIWVIGIAWAAEVVTLDKQDEFATLIEPLRYVSIIGLLTLFLWRFVKELELSSVKNGADVTTAAAISKLLRVSIIITATLSVLQTIGVSISGLLAFGGIGGIAVGFAAKDILANFFGGLMIYLDRPFAVGDWIRSPDREIEGTVEAIGWRLTLIRTFDKRPLYVPNSIFANIAVENPSRMSHRRIYENIGLRYADANQVAAIVNDVRERLRHHPDIDSTQTLIVNLNHFAPSSLEFFVYTFTKTVNWVRFHEVKEAVLLEILETVADHGAEVAFPTTTLHIANDDDPPHLAAEPA